MLRAVFDGSSNDQPEGRSLDYFITRELQSGEEFGQVECENSRQLWSQYNKLQNILDFTNAFC